MKLLHVTFQFQYADAVEAIVSERGVKDFVHHPRVSGRDRDGAHDGSQAFPGHMASIEALVDDAAMPELLDALRRFRDEKRAHAHLCAVVLPVEEVLT